MFLIAVLVAQIAAEGEPPSEARGPDEAATAGRRLPVALPTVGSVDFQDLDLKAGDIRGTVSWSPPPDLTEVAGYEVYLSDAAGSLPGRLDFGFVPVGTNLLDVDENTTLAGRTHLFVHVRSSLGANPVGVSVEVCDVVREDSLAVRNAAATAAGPWGVVELSFHRDPRCEDAPMRWAEGSASSNEAALGLLADGDMQTAWTADCGGGPCAAGTQRLEVFGVCRVEEVRCVQIWQCKPDGSYGCPAGSGRANGIALLVNGELVYTWPGLAGMPLLRHEKLAVPGRRRRASFGVSSEAEERPEQKTACFGNSPTFECMAVPPLGP